MAAVAPARPDGAAAGPAARRPQPVAARGRPHAAAPARQRRVLAGTLAAAHSCAGTGSHWAHPRHICAGTGLTPATSAPGPGSPPPANDEYLRVHSPLSCRPPARLAHSSPHGRTGGRTTAGHERKVCDVGERPAARAGLAQVDVLLSALPLPGGHPLHLLRGAPVSVLSPLSSTSRGISQREQYHDIPRDAVSHARPMTREGGMLLSPGHRSHSDHSI